MYLPCGKYTTFGISSPFELLSPSQRQVVYALLTRLPLGIFSSLSLEVLSTYFSVMNASHS